MPYEDENKEKNKDNMRKTKEKRRREVLETTWAAANIAFL